MALFLTRRRMAGAPIPDTLPRELLPGPATATCSPSATGTLSGVAAQNLFPAAQTPSAAWTVAGASPGLQPVPAPSHSAQPPPAAPAGAGAGASREDPFAAIYAANNAETAAPAPGDGGDGGWGMSEEEAGRYGAAFERADGDGDGYVTGVEARPILASLGAGLPKADLRQVPPAPPTTTTLGASPAGPRLSEAPRRVWRRVVVLAPPGVACRPCLISRRRSRLVCGPAGLV